MVQVVLSLAQLILLQSIHYLFLELVLQLICGLDLFWIFNRRYILKVSHIFFRSDILLILQKTVSFARATANTFERTFACWRARNLSVVSKIEMHRAPYTGSTKGTI